MTDTLRAALELLKMDLKFYEVTTEESDYSRAYNAGARQATARAVRYIEHALSKQDDSST